MRNLPQSFRDASFAQESDEAFITLLTLEHPSLAAPLRVSTDSVDTVSRGETFVAYPVHAWLPSDEEGVAPVARVKVDNVDREISAALQAINSPPVVTIETVLSSNPDEVIVAYTNFRLQRATYNEHSVEGDLTLRQYGQEPFPPVRYTPGRFRSIFRKW